MDTPTLEKQLNILDYALSSLWRRRWKNLSVLLVFTGVIFLIASFQLVTRSLTETAEEVLVAAPDITVQRMQAGRQVGVPRAYAKRLRKIFGIRKILPRIWGYYFDSTNGANYTVMGIDPETLDQDAVFALPLESGHLYNPEGGEVVLGQALAPALKLGDRKTFSLFRPDLTLKAFRVAGRFATTTNVLTNDLMVMTLEDGRDLFQMAEDQVTDLCLTIANPTELNTIAKKVADLLPDCRILTRPQIRKTYQVVFGWRSGFASICLLAALAAFTILAWDKASGLSPEERREIGILKILGWQTADVLTVRFFESVLVSGLAFVIGVSLAYLHILVADGTLFHPLMLGWSVLKPPIQLLPSIHLADILQLFSFTILPYLAATVIPAWRCATVPVDSAIR